MKTLTLTACLSLLVAFSGCSGNGNGDNDAGVDAYDAGGDGAILCTHINDCPAKHLCIGGFCEPGTECHTEEDCPDGYSCNFLGNVCIPEDQCASNEECTEASAPYCMTTSGMCVACYQDRHCSPQYCGPDWSCVVCTEDEHCDAELICNADNVCVDPTGCEDDGDCQDVARPRCNTDDGQCYGCLIDTHCAPQFCDLSDHQCVECFSDAQCMGELCDPSSSTCVACLSDQDCLPGEHCHSVTHECSDFFCTSDSDCTEPAMSWCNNATGDCVQCVISDNCGYTQWCRDLQCQDDCLTDAECIEKFGQNQHCDVGSGDCFEAACMTDNDCTGTPETPHCKLAASPSDPPQYSCVECTLDDHCDEYFECSPTAFTCRVMPCYRYPEPHETCHQIDPCYYCDMGDGTCGPAYDCTYPDGTECCQGYTCNSYNHCERNIDCEIDIDCPADSICNTGTGQCVFQSCCDPQCGAGEYCTGGCECVSTCHELGDQCDPMSQNCCEGLICGVFWPFCSEI